MERWVLTAVWATLPLTAGGAVSDAGAHWPTAPAVVAAALCWAAWAVALLAVVVPRPTGLTVVRLVAPDFAVVAVVVLAAGPATASAGVAVVAAVVAAVLAARPPAAAAAVNAVAYGDEVRFPLRVPAALFFGPLPAVRLLVGAGIAAGPLLLANRQWVAGGICAAVGVPVVWLGCRALHGLSTRFTVLVPAGFVVVDPLTLADPVLFVRERIVVLAAVDPDTPAPPGTLDLRLGASAGSVMLLLDRDAELFRSTRARRGSEVTHASALTVAVCDRPGLLRAAGSRRIPVRDVTQVAMPPPSSTSPA
ncbi:MAG: hypothetical protein WCI50_13295 [Actinomycetes bacterium]